MRYTNFYEQDPSGDAGNALDYGVFLRNLPGLINDARSSYVNADSYRFFGVGSSGMFTTEDGLVIVMGRNLKPEPDVPKICAEKDLLAHAEQVGAVKMIGMVVVATTDREQIEEVNGFASPTLKPCKDCVAMLNDSDIVDNTSLIVTAGANLDILEVNLMSDLSANEANTDTVEAIKVDLRNKWPTAQEAYSDRYLKHGSPVEAFRLAVASTTQLA
jgi:Cytidine and deoxycytidylate deaminase zinc-binding region